jgi:hypothetical protein
LSTDAKRLATCQARAARRGMTLHRIESDDGKPLFVATFFALTRHFDDIGQVELWLDRVDGARPLAVAA